MNVIVAKNAGFCGGVKSAVDKALELAKKYGHIYTLGELVHNELVTDFLKSNGVDSIEIDRIDTLKAGDVALIRAHGIPIELEQSLRDRGVIVEDATCPVVKRNQKLAKERAELGDDIIIIGDEKHDEVVGIMSYAGERCKVVSDGEMLEIGDNPTSILFQTTVLQDKYEKIACLAENFEKNQHKSVGFFNTICYNTTVRQNEVRALAGKSDAVLVLGAAHSANTRRLAQAAREVNPNVVYANSADEVLSSIGKFKDINCVSIVAGASTPPWLIREVNKLMSETQNNAAVAAEVEVKKEATLQEQTKSDNKESLTMADLMKTSAASGNYTSYRVGKRIKGTVISADEKGIYVTIGGKKDGFIDKSEATLDGNYNPSDYKEGDEVHATILAVKELVLLSKKAVDAIRAEEEAAEKALSSGEFTLVMTEVAKGGLRGRLGQYTVFVPASQIKIGFVKNLEEYKGKKLRLVLIPPKDKNEAAKAVEGEEVATEAVEEKPAKRSKYLFASQRIILEREKKEKEDAFWGDLHVNDIKQGKVKRFTPFGAFVSIDGFDCLAHISELSWNKITDPSSVLKIGDVKDFVILRLDREHGKISLGYKQLQRKPYEIAAEKYPVGTVIKGKVERIFPFGAFVSIEEGIDGLVHVSQISHNWVKDANEVLTVGQEVEAKIIGFEDTRITLSIKELLPTPEETAVEVDAEATEEEKASKRNSRMKKFEQKVAD
nr:4-hydroxy-3-methylbut-2-enyl diphosphate reductase [Clostridia bacterium]